MKPKSEELLYFLLYFADMASRPTYRNLEQSFEHWAYSKGLYRQLDSLEAGRFVERRPGVAVGRIYRLTEKGRLHSLGGRNPEALWRADWNGVWRIVLFDIPRVQNTARDRLRRMLHAEGFGCLQHSVWISPRPLSERILGLCYRGDDLGTVLTIAGRPDAGEKDADIVKQAWDFERINDDYATHAQVLKQRPIGTIRDDRSAISFRGWAAQERAAWIKAVQSDPLLPEKLLPQGYLGWDAWKRRKKVLARAATQMSSSQTMSYVRDSLGEEGE